MKTLIQGASMLHTDRIGENEMLTKASCLSSDYECAVILKNTILDFKITGAGFGVLRTPDNRREEGELPELIGGSAGFDGAKEVKALRDFKDGGKIKELFMECLRAVNQSETWVAKEKGYETREDYEEFWQADKNDFCRPYQKKQNFPPLNEWPAHIGAYDYIRTTHLYNKYKSYTIFQEEGDTAFAIGTFQDSFHEMTALIKFGISDKLIKSFDISTYRAPHKPCFDMSHTAAESFKGKPINGFSKKEVGAIIGGGPGCFHLTDIVTDICQAAASTYALNRLSR